MITVQMSSIRPKFVLAQMCCWTAHSLLICELTIGLGTQNSVPRMHKSRTSPLVPLHYPSTHSTLINLQAVVRYQALPSHPLLMSASQYQHDFNTTLMFDDLPPNWLQLFRQQLISLRYEEQKTIYTISRRYYSWPIRTGIST